MITVAVVQARMGSSRLPGKVLREICGVPMIELLLRRLSLSREIDEIVVATPATREDQSLRDLVNSLGYACYQGSNDDVLDRYYQAAKEASADVIVRITGDCPLVDPSLVDSIVRKFHSAKADFVENTSIPTFPDGLDVEVFSFSALRSAWHAAESAYDREHVTPYLRRNLGIKKVLITNPRDLSRYRWTVDELEDVEVVRSIFEHFSPSTAFSWLDIIELYRHTPDLFDVNQHLVRNEGSQMSSGQKLWRRAKKVIPGGNMLLSKRPELFLPEQWPAYFSTAKGCLVTDLDGREYVDMSLMGVGTNILGYGHEEVDEAVRSTLSKGNMCTLNCPEEVYLAERLIEMHPWADMVRFARTGGEANAIGVRIARAAVGKECVAICGYHGWHDWYLAANLADDRNLSGHLLPGLDPRGVPSSLAGTTYAFTYNNFQELEDIVSKHDIGVIKMEVQRNEEPRDGFLEKVRELATTRGIVLIFDECTSGFRQSFGGLHKTLNVEPDMAIFGKALGNGYAITAVLGRREVMESAQGSFISSTFWTERIGPTAALKTLEVMERTEAWKIITRNGLNIRSRWQSLADKYGLDIVHSGIPALAGFNFLSDKALAYKTLITQEMLGRGFLAANSVYTCLAHTSDILDRYFFELDQVFALIRQCEDGRDVMGLLRGPVCHSGFRRLN